MIKQLAVILSLLFSLFLLSSCSIFGGDSGDGGEEENYYEGEDQAEDGGIIEEAEAEGIAEESEQMGQVDTDEEEDIYYIDEEDEDILEAEAGDGVGIEIIEDESITDQSDGYESSESSESSDSSEKSPSFFSEKSAPSPPSPKVVIPKKTWIPYKKIKNQAYKAAGFLVNTVYIARSGEDIQSVSETIFGTDQVNQLYAINPHLKARGVKVGDKIYYQSSHRSQDSSQLLFYFEDKGIQPNYHQVQAGENIRTVASQLLGHAESWKEIWATNPDLQSKGKLDQSVTIKYWPPGRTAGGGGMEEPVPPSSPQPAPSPEEGTEEGTEEALSPPPTDEVPHPEEPPSPPEEGKMENPPPVPPPSDQEDDAISSPPESSPVIDKIRDFSRMDMILAGILALIALICAVLIIRKRVNKKKDFDYTAANFEIDE